jgi:copper transport protein
VLAFVLFSARPAAAHAVLLRTEPSPQTTVAAPPDAVRLRFSEPVEVAFGAVRVFDVDGKRVDEGRLETADGRRELVVPAELRGGTYTVTWRVLSTDGHRISGGFQFFVGAPSTISAVAVEGDAGAGRAITWGYGVVRFTWYSALLAVVGLIAVRRFVWTPAVRAAGLVDSDAADRFRRRFNRLLPLAWGVLLVAWLLRLVFQAASVSGLGLLESARPGVLGDMLGTGFGRSWLTGLGFTLLAGLPVAGLTRRAGLFGARHSTWLSIIAACAAGLAMAAANTGHARTEGNPVLGVPSAAIHLLAVSTWVGGLAGLVVLGGSTWAAVAPEDRNGLLRHVVARFSRLALVAVAVVVVSGSVNSFLDLASVSDLWDTAYGRVLSAKIALLTVALAFGGWHLWGLPRGLGASEAPDAGGAARSFRRSSTLELVVLTAVVGFASALVALVPGRSLALQDRGPVNQEERAGRYTVQLFLDPSTPGTNEIHVTFIDPNGLGASEMTAVSVTLGGEDGAPQPLPMKLISPGHFVANRDLAAGVYRLALQTDAPSPVLSVSFEFKLRTGPRGSG